MRWLVIGFGQESKASFTLNQVQDRKVVVNLHVVQLRYGGFRVDLEAVLTVMTFQIDDVSAETSMAVIGKDLAIRQGELDLAVGGPDAVTLLVHQPVMSSA